MRVLAIGHSYVVRENRGIVREVARDPGFRVTVVAPRFFRGDLRPIAIEDEPPDSPLEVIPIDAWATGWVQLFRYDAGPLRRLLRERSFDVIDAWEEPYVYAGYQIARLAAPTSARFSFWTMQNIDKKYPPPFGFFERSTVACADGWIACGRLVYDTMVARGYPASTGRVLPLAFDPVAFSPTGQAERTAVIGELGLSTPIVGFVGRLVESKGLDVLMQALDRLPVHVRWNLLVLGSGPYRSRIEAWAGRLNGGRRARVLLATHGQVGRYLGAMDVLVAPSRTTPRWREQFGRMLIEAMACGVPIIASDSGEIPHVVGDAGRIVREDDVDGYAREIGAILTDPAARAGMVRRGLERARLYSVSEVARQYRDFYRSLAGQAVAS